MRKIFVLTVAALCYFCTYSQEAEASGNVPTLIFSPRFEVNPYIRTGGGGYSGVDFGNSIKVTVHAEGEEGTTIVQYTILERDSKGNWIKRSVKSTTKWETETQIETRKITYR